MTIKAFQSINKHKHPFTDLSLNEESKMAPQNNDNTYGAFLFDVGSQSGTFSFTIIVIKNQQKVSTNVKTSSLGVSFHNSKSLIPMQFTSREYEMRAQRMLGSLQDPAPPDEMTYEQPSKGDYSSNMFEKFAPGYQQKRQTSREEAEDQQMFQLLDMDQFKVKNTLLK